MPYPFSVPQTRMILQPIFCPLHNPIASLECSRSPGSENPMPARFERGPLIRAWRLMLPLCLVKLPPRHSGAASFQTVSRASSDRPPLWLRSSHKHRAEPGEDLE